LGTTTKKDTIQETLRVVAERGARLEAIQALIAIDRDWTGIVDDDKVPDSEPNTAWHPAELLSHRHLSLGTHAGFRGQHPLHGDPSGRCHGDMPAAGS
jgi:hypothetical protein